jgi:hypothetical protein
MSFADFDEARSRRRNEADRGSDSSGTSGDEKYEEDNESDQGFNNIAEMIKRVVGEQVNSTAVVKEHAMQVHEETKEFNLLPKASTEDIEMVSIRKAEEAFKSAEEALKQARTSLARAETSLKETKSEFILKKQQHENLKARKAKKNKDDLQSKDEPAGMPNVADVFLQSSQQFSSFMVRA